MIHYSQKTKNFTLISKQTQLTLAVLESGHLCTMYFGKKIGEVDLNYLLAHQRDANYMAFADGIVDFQPEILPLTFPSFGHPDLRTPAFQIMHENGNRISDFRFESYKIHEGKPPLKGLPSSHVSGKVQTLEICLKDQTKEEFLFLFISVFEDYDVMSQHIVFENRTAQSVVIKKMLSLNLPFLQDHYELVTLGGAWGRETHVDVRQLHMGSQGIDSKRGISGHGQNPFVALQEIGTGEEHGEVYGAGLVYSGNFVATAEVDMHENVNLQLGINPFDFSWTVLSGESFTTPEAVFTYSDQGLNKMSHIFHRFIIDCILPPLWKNKERPILVNSWEAAYFDFDRPVLLELAKASAEVGAELFVLDDGWFGQRNADNSSLGDWEPNEEKLGGSLESLVEEVNNLGLSFGIWVEPEMISPKSNLFEKHPDWVISCEGYTPQLSRNQMVLDVSREDVQEYIIEKMDRIFSIKGISYVKWDMNRSITDAGSLRLEAYQQEEQAHRYVLGLYKIFETLTTRHPDILFEGCAGGGGRFDLGTLCYTPQVWSSDCTDPITRLSIQKGLSLFYPSITMGSHVSAVPNHQTGRITSLETRGAVAMAGNLGYELSIPDLETSEKEEVKKQIAFYKKNRELIQFGIHYRLQTVHPENEKAWMKKSRNGKMIYVTYISILSTPNTLPKRLRLLGLEEGAYYKNVETGERYLGSELLNIGLVLPKITSDFSSAEWIFEKQ